MIYSHSKLKNSKTNKLKNSKHYLCRHEKGSNGLGHDILCRSMEKADGFV